MARSGPRVCTLDEFFVGHGDSRPIFDALEAAVRGLGAVQMRVTKSQVVFRRRAPFAWTWVPGRYLRGPCAPLVLTLVRRQPHPSPRFKEIVEPAPGRFMHHLELHSEGEIDAEVRDWLREVWEEAE